MVACLNPTLLVPDSLCELLTLAGPLAAGPGWSHWSVQLGGLVLMVKWPVSGSTIGLPPLMPVENEFLPC